MNKYLIHIVLLIKSSLLFSQKSDTLLNASLFLKKLEQNISRQDTEVLKRYSIPEFENKSIWVNITIEGKKLNYKIWSSEAYSLASGWFILVIIMKDKILFSEVMNESGKMAGNMNMFSLEAQPGGVIKVILYRKGGQKIFEKKVCYKINFPC